MFSYRVLGSSFFCCCLWVAKVCPIPCNPVDGSLPGLSVQAKILEWVAISYSRGSSRPRIEPESSALQAESLPRSRQGGLLVSLLGLSLLFAFVWLPCYTPQGDWEWWKWWVWLPLEDWVCQPVFLCLHWMWWMREMEQRGMVPRFLSQAPGGWWSYWLRERTPKNHLCGGSVHFYVPGSPFFVQWCLTWVVCTFNDHIDCLNYLNNPLGGFCTTLDPAKSFPVGIS